MKINAYSDPGHGWAAVPLSLLQRLDLLDRVTPYSYLRGRFAYLEEDCDLSTFMDAARAAGLKIEFRQTVSGYRRSRIRGYASYHPEHAKKILAELRRAAV